MQAGQTELNGSERAYAEVSQRLAEAKLDAKNLGAQLLLLGETKATETLDSLNSFPKANENDKSADL